MDWVSGGVALGGVAVAVLTLLLTYRSRLSPYQQKLFEKQLDAATDVLQAFGRYHDEAMAAYAGNADAGPDALTRLAEAKTEFFRSYRRWNVVIPQPVTEAVTGYLQILERVVTPPAKSIRLELSTGYAAVLGAAQRELRVKTLSGKTLSLIESLARTPPDQGPGSDPLYVKVVAERRIFEGFHDESATSGPGGPASGRDDLRTDRNGIYAGNSNLFIVHVWRPSRLPGQVADISIRLAEHERHGRSPRDGQASQERPLTDGIVERVEYYLGSSFRRTFDKHDAGNNFRLDISAYGPTLCVARVHFTDGRRPVTLQRYLDFVAPEPGQGQGSVRVEAARGEVDEDG